MSCSIITNKIRELAKSFPNETNESINNLVAIWREDNNLVDGVPSVEEITKLISELREEDDIKYQKISNTSNNNSSSNIDFESHFETSGGTNYRDRTIANAKWSDITLAIAFSFNTAGEKLTKKAAGNKWIGIDANHSLNDELLDNIIKDIESKKLPKDNIKLNIAGNGLYTVRALGKSTLQSNMDKGVTNIIKGLMERGITISEIRSGGQTGVDEAGIKAAQRLGIPWKVVAPADYAFRGEDGKDIRGDKETFMSRFKDDSSQLQNDEYDTSEYGDAAGMIDDMFIPSFDSPTLSTPKEQSKVDLDFNPQQRRDRVTLIAKQFNFEVDDILEEMGLDPELDDRRKVFEKHTPGDIFKRVFNTFNDIYTSSMEDKIENALWDINNSEDYKDLNDSEKREIAKKEVEHLDREYKKIIDNFVALAEEACSQLALTEGILVDVNSLEAKDINFREGNDEGDTIGEKNSDDFDKEEKGKESWMQDYREISSYEAISQKIRRMIASVPRLNKNGQLDKDDLGYIRYLDAGYVHAVLMDSLRNIITAEDVIPMLQKMAITKPWVKLIIEKLQNDDTLFSQFYQNYRKDFIQYWIQKKVLLPGGNYRMETMPINRPEGTYYLLDSWRANYEGGLLLDADSIYNEKGEIVEENATKGLELVEELANAFNNLSNEEKIKKIKTENDIFDKIVKVLRMIGVDTDEFLIKEGLIIDKSTEKIKVENPINNVLLQLNVIFSNIKKGKNEKEILEDGSIKEIDLINTFGTAYNSIANTINEVANDAIESSCSQTIDGKTKSFYGHTPPNYLGKLIKQLKAANGNMEQFKKFLQEEFKGYEWFYKDGKWYCDLLEQLENSESMRKGFQHKAVLASDGVGYSNLDPLSHAIAVINEYWGSPDDSRSEEKWGWYAVPIQSDANSFDFIRMKRYMNGVIIDEYGNKKTYQDIIMDKFVDLITQEYNRIAVVTMRFLDRKAGKKGLEEIPNYDISVKENGDIKSLGGAEFKFFPQLNNLGIDKEGNVVTITPSTLISEEADKDGTLSFLNALRKTKREGSGESIKALIEKFINHIMEEGFENDYMYWSSIGLLNETKNGMMEHFNQAGDITNKKNALVQAKKILDNSWTREMEAVLNTLAAGIPIRNKDMARVIQQINSLIEDKIYNKELSRKEAENITKKLNAENKIKEKLREFYWNNKLATSQIIQITTTDLAFYRDIEDFQKRFKEIHSPALRLNTMAKYKGETVGKPYEKVMYLSDEIITSKVYSTIQSVLDAKVRDKKISKIDRDYILTKFREVNVADAQAFRSLKSWREVQIMAGEWNDDMQRAYDNFRNNKWDMQDFTTLWQTKKPFLYTQVKKIVGYNEKVVDGKNTGELDYNNPIYQKVPVQHKNSEFLLLAIYPMIASSLGKSDKLTALNEFMEENNIDLIQFESAVKVGGQGKININSKISKKQKKDLDKALHSGKITQEQYNEEIAKYNFSKKDIKDTLKKYAFPDNQENPNIVHTISYEDYGIQTATPEHFIDATQLIGTQLRKLITADMPDSMQITINGKTLSKKEWLDLYNAINTENIIQKFMEVNSLFSDPKEISKILIQSIRESNKYDKDMIKAVSLDENGNFNIPLYDPITTMKVQNLINSIIKSRITKQKIKGGSLIQVSDFGLTDELKIVFKDKDGNELDFNSFKKKKGNQKKTLEDYNEFIKQALKDGNLAIAYFECYMPAYSKALFEPLMKPGTHELDITKLPEDLRKLIGYRIPTENKYSMAPLYIKGFLPQQNGSAIMLPSEITTLSGSDFDIDKLYVMLHEFTIRHYDMKAAREAYAKENESFNEFLSMFNNSEFMNDLSETDPIEFKQWFNENKEKFKLKAPVISKIKYDYNKSPKENGLLARNNLMIDMMWGVLTNVDTTQQILDPGGFDPQKKAARIINILTNGMEADIREKLNIPKGGSILSKLMSMDLDDLNSFVKKTVKPLDPLSSTTQTALHSRNMTGAKLIPVYANHNANHAIIQHTDITIDEGNGGFVLNGKKLLSLHEISNKQGEYISKIVSGFLAASVDNAKDPILSDLNQNLFTADMAMLLARLGYSPIEIGLFLSQPIVMEITSEYLKGGTKKKSVNAIVESALEKYKKLANKTGTISFSSYSKEKFLIEDLANNILKAKEVKNLTSIINNADFDKVKFYAEQLAVGYLFQRIKKSSDALGDLVKALRADTSNGGAGPSIANTMIKIQQLEGFMANESEVQKSNDNDNVQKQLKSTYPLKNIRIIDPNLEYDGDEDAFREKILNSKVPFIQAFYTAGLKETEKMMGRYFPQYKESFKKVVTQLKGISKHDKLDDKTINTIYNDLFVYILTKKNFFGAETNGQKNVTMEDKRRSFVNNFIDYFEEVVSENPDIAELEFIKRLKVKRKNRNCPVDILTFKNVGTLTQIQREKYERDWMSLMYSNNPKAQELALNLFRYGFFRHGLGFGPNSYIHLAPAALRMAVPEYIETLREIMDSEDDYTPFVKQFVYNHLDNKKLVTEISSESTINFIDSEGDIDDMIVVSISDNSRYEDKEIIKSVVNTPYGESYIYVDYIKTKIKGNYVYYELDYENSLKLDIAIYNRIYPLGVKNNFIEYEYGKEVEMIESQIGKNTETFNYNPSQDPGNVDVDWETLDNSPDWIKKDQEIIASSVVQEAFSYIYGAEEYGDIAEEYQEEYLNTLEEKKEKRYNDIIDDEKSSQQTIDLNEMPSFEEYKTEDDQPLCKAMNSPKSQNNLPF